MDYHFRIYYLTKDVGVIKKIKEKFSTIVSVNGESTITTDEHGAFLLEETERRGIIRIREKSITDMRSTKP
jgi:hypothetical protein